MTKRVVFLAPWLALATGLALVPAAGAATVRPGQVPTGPIYTAGPGEHNRLEVSWTPRWVYFKDSGAFVRGIGSCQAVDGRTARCRRSFTAEVVVKLGDRNDRALSRTPRDVIVNLHGGTGDDAITGGRGFDRMLGGPGRDTLRGQASTDLLHAGSGRDRVFGGAGDDHLFDDRRRQPTSRDLFDGGQGRDEVDYLARRQEVNVDLGKRPGVAGAERDRLFGIESVSSGGSSSIMRGNDVRNDFVALRGDSTLVGRGGDDGLLAYRGYSVLRGGAGDDSLTAFRGPNLLYGGTGNDGLATIDAYSTAMPRRPSTVDCGAGERDEITTAPADVVSGCEQALGWEEVLEVGVEPAIAGGSATYTASCYPYRRSCSGIVTMTDRDGDVDYGQAEFEIPRTRRDPASIVVPLTAAGEQAIAEGGQVRVTFRSAPEMLFADAPDGTRYTFGYTAGLRAG